MSIFNLSAHTHEQCISRVARAQYMSYLKVRSVTRDFCKLVHELYCNLYM